MKPRKDYVAKEAFTFPLICLVCLASFIYWGCTDGWRVGAIVGTSFFGIITLVYIFKYLRFGRDVLRIDAGGITYKEWGKTSTLKWTEIAKCTVCYRPSYGGVLFYRELDMASAMPRRYSFFSSGRLGITLLNVSAIFFSFSDIAVTSFGLSSPLKHGKMRKWGGILWDCLIF